MTEQERVLAEWAADQPHAYVTSELGKGYIRHIEPGPFDRRVYSQHQPIVVLADGTRTYLPIERNLSDAVHRLRQRLGVES